jgi:hypothetical protein
LPELLKKAQDVPPCCVRNSIGGPWGEEGEG